MSTGASPPASRWNAQLLPPRSCLSGVDPLSGQYALPTDLFPLDVVDWFVLPDSDLQLDSDTAPLSPREWLLSGRPVEAVVKLASDLTRA